MITSLLSQDGCRNRQRRLLEVMNRLSWDFFLTGNPRTVYSLTSALIPIEQPALFLLRADGTSVLISPQDERGFVDDRRKVPVYSPIRPIRHPFDDAAEQLAELLLRGSFRRAGIELEYTPAVVLRSVPESIEIDDAGDVILNFRRAKDTDELEEIRRSLHLNAVAYDAAKKVLRPGLTEIELHAAMSTAVANELGVTIPLAGDFSCGLRSLKEGGAPTGRRIEPNELCVLDLFLAPAYYFGDTCRTFCAGKPDAQQLEAWHLIQETLSLAERTIRPGIEAKEVYSIVRQKLDAHPLTQGTFWHHAGHGVGCQGHETPRLIPESDDVMQEGDIIAIEPAIYIESLRGGLRLENTYRVGSAGLENMFDYPMEMDVLG